MRIKSCVRLLTVCTTHSGSAIETYPTFRSYQIAILTISKALNFDFGEFLSYLTADIQQAQELGVLKMVKTGIFEHLKKQKISFT